MSGTCAKNARLIAVALGVLALTGAVSPALAQTGPTAGAGHSEDGESLSSKLSKSGGVITPKPDVDPGMKVPAPAPQPNSTPVIPPSATGGNTAK